MKNLTVVTLVYIILPTYLFNIFWVKTEYAFISTIALTIALLFSINKIGVEKTATQNLQLPAILISSSLIALTISYFSEFGGFHYQSYDYQAHNFKFNLLTTKQLPLYDSSRDIYMCYYLGYYIVPSLLGKMTSLALVRSFAFIWTWLGLTLSFVWVQVRLKDLAVSKRLLICFLLVIGSYVSALIPALRMLLNDFLTYKNNSIIINERFTLNQLPILSKSLSEATQHTLPAFLGICFFIAVSQYRQYVYAFGIFIFSTLFWTPFTAIGLSLFYLAYIFQVFKAEQFQFLVRFAVFGLILLVAFSPVILFLVSSEATSMESNIPIWKAGDPFWIFYYLLYLCCFFGVWFVFFRKSLAAFDHQMLWVAFTSFALIGLFQLGHFNDLNTRASIPAQVVLGLSIAFALVTNLYHLRKSPILIAGVLFWFLNSFSFFKFYYERLLTLNEGAGNSIEHPEMPAYGTNYYTFLEKAYVNGQEVVKQYSLKKNSIFEKYLLKHQK